MAVWIITLGIMGLFFVFMSVGLLMGGKPIKGSCGGLANVDGLETCELCDGSPQKCEELALKLGRSGRTQSTLWREAKSDYER